MKIERKHFFLGRGESFDIELGRYATYKEIPEVAKRYQETFLEKKYSLKDTSSTYRHVNHWETEGLIDSKRGAEAKWRKFNLLDLVWIKTIATFRDFGISIEKIKIIKECLFEHPILWEYYCFLASIKKQEVKILVYLNGEAHIGTMQQVHLHDTLIYEENRIHISLTAIIEELLGKKITREDPTNITLTKTEESLFSKIYDMGDGNFEGKVQGGRIERFSKTGKKKQVEVDKDLNLRKLIEKHPFHKITIHTDKVGKINDIIVENKSA